MFPEPRCSARPATLASASTRLRFGITRNNRRHLLLLRNCPRAVGEDGSFEDESGVGLDEVEAEGLSALAEAMKEARAVALVVDGGGLFAVG